MKKTFLIFLSILFCASMSYAGDNEKYAKKTKYEIACFWLYNLDRPTLVDVDGLAAPLWNRENMEIPYIGSGQGVAIGMQPGEHVIQLYTTDYALYKTIRTNVSSYRQYHYNVAVDRYATYDDMISWINPYFLRAGGALNSMLHTPPEYFKFAVKRTINTANGNVRGENVHATLPSKASAVDNNVPISKVSSDNTYVLIIANENYENLSPVSYAANDGQIFKQYCTQTLGVPEKQIRYCVDATFGNMAGAVDWLTYALDNFAGAKAIVYYCGHGIPDEKTNQAYLIPVDGKGTNTSTCYSLNKLYKTLAATKAQSITYFMDACFTGANKEGSMLVAARGVARAPEKETLSGKTIVFSASSGDETAMTLKDEGHGLFTYYLLKKLQESEGNVTYGELADYINQNVKKDAFLINEKPQTPIVATSPAVVNTWKQMKLK